MRNAALPIDWGFLPPFSPKLCSLFLIPSYTCVSSPELEGGGRIRLGPVYVCPCTWYRGISWQQGRKTGVEKNAGTNLGTVRMEMPCRCYSHLHSDFRYKPLCPRTFCLRFLSPHSLSLSLSLTLLSYLFSISSFRLFFSRFLLGSPVLDFGVYSSYQFPRALELTTG